MCRSSIGKTASWIGFWARWWAGRGCKGACPDNGRSGAACTSMGTPPKDRRWLQWVLGAAGILLGVAAAALIFGHRAPAPLPPSHGTAPTALYVQHDGGARRLHWDPAVHAKTGVIWIQDCAR